MKKTILFLVLINIQLSFAQYSYSDWKDDNPYELYNKSHFQFINDSVGWIMPTSCRENNAIFKTIDGGENWFFTSKFDNADFQAWQKPFIFTDTYTGYYFSYKSNSGQYYKIWKTTDGGISWVENYNFPYHGYVENSFFLNGSRGWIVYERTSPSFQELLFTNDGGDSWSVIYNFHSTDDDLIFIKFFNESNGLFVKSRSNNSTLYKTNDGGHSWVNVYSWNTLVSSFKFISQNTGYVTVNGILNKTTNGGQTWTTYFMPGGRPVDKVETLGESFIMTTGTRGYPTWTTSLNVSTNSGATWIASTVPGYENQIFSIQILTPNKIYFTNLRYLLKTKNFGQDWEKIPIGPTHNLESLIYVQGGEPFAVGWKQDSLTLKYEGAIVSSPPLWRAKTIYIYQKLKCISAKNNSEIFIGGYDYKNGGKSIIYKCNNKGDSLEIKYSSSGQIVNSICFLDNLNGVAVGGLGMILKTSDGGDNWFEESSFTNEDLNIIIFNSQLGFIGGSSGILYRTSDSGSSWTQINLGTNKEIKSILIQNQNNIWLVGKNGLTMKSEDEGLTWYTINASSEFDFNFITMKDQLHLGIYGGKIVDNSALIKESHDGGFSWVYPSTSLQLKSINYFCKDFSGSKAWAVGDYGTVYSNTYSWVTPVELTSFNASISHTKVQLNWQTATELNNQGFEIQRKIENSDWFTIGFRTGKGTTTELTSYFYEDDISEINSDKLYYRLKQIDYSGTFSYSNEVEVITQPLDFALYQNYPNPFNPVTIIKYEIPKNSNVKLEIFDVLGRKVTTLVNEEKQAGRYKEEFDASVLASGIYYYRIVAEGFTSTKKMMLLK